jgi:hypothetical protein
MPISGVTTMIDTAKRRPVTQKVIRAFRSAIDIELAGNREKDQQRYRDILYDIAVWLDLETHEWCPLYLDNNVAPEWIGPFDELHFLWARAHQALQERQAAERLSAERRRLRSA